MNHSFLPLWAAAVLLSVASLHVSPGRVPLVPLLFAQDHPGEYRAGTFCSPNGDIVGPVQTKDHPCHCKRMAESPDCESVVTEDTACLQYCHSAHCRCPIACSH